MSKLVLAGVALILTGASLFAYLYKEHPVVLKVAAGNARVLSPPMKADISVDGQEQSQARCFRMNSYFNGAPSDSLVLWLPESSSPYGREVLIVDSAHHTVGTPNYGKQDYHLLWDRFLFQSESGSLMVSFTDPKSYAKDPELAITEHEISFRVPTESEHLGGKRIQLAF
jgi:hypothetical protein